MKKIRNKNIWGSAMVEMAIVAIFAVPMISLSSQVWQTLSIYDELEYIACAGARFASLQSPPLDNINTATRTYIQNNILPRSFLDNFYAANPSAFDVSVTFFSQGTDLDNDPKNTINQGDALRVNIQMLINGPNQVKSFLLRGGQPTRIVRSCTYTHLLE